MFKKYLFLSITLGIFAVLTATLLSPTKTFAWAELTEPAYTFDIATKMDEQTASGTYAEMSNWRDRNYAVYEYNNGSNTGTVIMGVWDTTGSRAGSITDGGSGFTSINAALLCRWTMDGSYLYGCQWGGGLSADHVFNVHLTQEYIDAQNPETWTPPDGYLGGGSGNPLDPENNNTPRCQPWDVVCWFSATVDSVVDGFQSLANFFGDTIKALGEWIANLIMPSNADGGFDNRFIDFFTTVQDTMTERLGFLLFPFQFFADLIASFTTIYNPYGTDSGCTSGSIVAIPNLLGDADVSLDLCGIEDTPIWTPASTLLRFVWIIGLVTLLQRKYMSTVRA